MLQDGSRVKSPRRRTNGEDKQMTTFVLAITVGLKEAGLGSVDEKKIFDSMICAIERKA